MIVFNAVEEFLKELETDKDLIERKIVRLTALYQQSKTVPLRYLFVVATYKAAGELVEYREHAGDLWGMTNLESDKKAIQKSVELSNRIEEECKRLGLEVRAGMYKEGGEI